LKNEINRLQNETKRLEKAKKQANIQSLSVAKEKQRQLELETLENQELANLQSQLKLSEQQEQLEQERLEKERLEKERLEKERLEKEQLELERLAQELERLKQGEASSVLPGAISEGQNIGPINRNLLPSIPSIPIKAANVANLLTAPFGALPPISSNAGSKAGSKTTYASIGEPTRASNLPLGPLTVKRSGSVINETPFGVNLTSSVNEANFKAPKKKSNGSKVPVTSERLKNIIPQPLNLPSTEQSDPNITRIASSRRNKQTSKSALGSSLLPDVLGEKKIVYTRGGYRKFNKKDLKELTRISHSSVAQNKLIKSHKPKTHRNLTKKNINKLKKMFAKKSNKNV